MQSPKYSLNAVDFKKILSATLYAAASAAISTLIIAVGELDFGAYTYLAPLINAILYSAERFLKGQ